jgi:hypothetical protein
LALESPVDIHICKFAHEELLIRDLYSIIKGCTQKPKVSLKEGFVEVVWPESDDLETNSHLLSLRKSTHQKIPWTRQLIPFAETIHGIV